MLLAGWWSWWWRQCQCGHNLREHRQPGVAVWLHNAGNCTGHWSGRAATREYQETEEERPFTPSSGLIFQGRERAQSEAVSKAEEWTWEGGTLYWPPPEEELQWLLEEEVVRVERSSSILFKVSRMFVHSNWWIGWFYSHDMEVLTVYMYTSENQCWIFTIQFCRCIALLYMFGYVNLDIVLNHFY